MNTKDVIDWVSEADNEMCVKLLLVFFSFWSNHLFLMINVMKMWPMVILSRGCHLHDMCKELLLIK